MPKPPLDTAIASFITTEHLGPTELVALEKLKLDPQNPRIRLQLSLGGAPTPKQDELLEVIRSQSGYDPLFKQIRDQGAVLEPLIVRHDGRIVEGNTRFAIATALSKTPDGKSRWGKVRVQRLDKAVSEIAVQLLMCNYHVSGKTPWRPASQADQVYHLTQLKAPLVQIMAATRLTKGEVEKYLAAYTYLLKEVSPLATTTQRREIIDSKFSHALEFVGRTDLEDARKDPLVRKEVGKAIAEGGIQGIQFRKLAPILKNARAREAFGRGGFKAAAEVMRKADPTGDSHAIKSIQKLTKELQSLAGKELDLFRTHEKAREVLEELLDATNGVLAIVTPKKAKQRA